MPRCYYAALFWPLNATSAVNRLHQSEGGPWPLLLPLHPLSTLFPGASCDQTGEKFGPRPSPQPNPEPNERRDSQKQEAGCNKIKLYTAAEAKERNWLFLNKSFGVKEKKRLAWPHPSHPNSTPFPLPLQCPLLLTSSPLRLVATLGRAHGETAVAGQCGHLCCYVEETVLRWWWGCLWRGQRALKQENRTRKIPRIITGCLAKDTSEGEKRLKGRKITVVFCAKLWMKNSTCISDHDRNDISMRTVGGTAPRFEFVSSAPNAHMATSLF